MILSTFTEGEVLKELYSDYYKEIKPCLKKNAKKSMLDYQKIGKKCDGFSLQLKLKTNSNNNWRSLIDFDSHTNRNAPWYSSSCCIVESSHGTKDYYILRGLNDKPYFIRFSAHAIKRLYERNRFEVEDLDFLPCLVFNMHETAIAVTYADFQYMKVLSKMDDVDKNGELSKMFFTFYGSYFGYMTPNHNFYIKTYISPQMAISGTAQTSHETLETDTEGMLSLIGYTLHQYFNKFMYTENELQFLYNQFPKGEEIDLSKANNITILRP